MKIIDNISDVEQLISLAKSKTASIPKEDLEITIDIDNEYIRTFGLMAWNPDGSAFLTFFIEMTKISLQLLDIIVTTKHVLGFKAIDFETNKNIIENVK